MELLGVMVDTRKLTLEVTPERVVEISLLVEAWLRKKKASLRDLQSLLGKLHFIATCVRTGRIFVRSQAYLSLFRPKLEYACSVWNPHTVEHCNTIEMVQRRAARYACNRYHNTSKKQILWLKLFTISFLFKFVIVDG
jgi:hypothetical protein